MTTVKLSDSVVKDVKKYASVYSRSVPKQIEHWCKIGQIVEENPDLSYEFVQQTLLGLKEMEDEQLSEYVFEK